MRTRKCRFASLFPNAYADAQMQVCLSIHSKCGRASACSMLLYAFSQMRTRKCMYASLNAAEIFTPSFKCNCTQPPLPHEVIVVFAWELSIRTSIRPTFADGRCSWEGVAPPISRRLLREVRMTPYMLSCEPTRSIQSPMPAFAAMSHMACTTRL